MGIVKIATAQYPIDFHKSFNDWKKKTIKWIEEASSQKAEVLLFPEYGAMELTSLLSESERLDLKNQAAKLKKFLNDFNELFRSKAIEHKIYIIAPSFPVFHDEFQTTNRVYVFSPAGKIEFQDKFYMTRFEDEDWNIQSGESVVKVFKNNKFSFSISTCFDVEFPLQSMVAAQKGQAQIIFAPSCTETIKGAHRVHIGARARALENQIYVVVAQTVGLADWSPAVDINYGYASIYSPPDLNFENDGIVVQGSANVPGWIYSELNLDHLETVRSFGSVLNYKTQQKALFHNNDFEQMCPISAKIINFD